MHAPELDPAQHRAKIARPNGALSSGPVSPRARPAPPRTPSSRSVRPVHARGRGRSRTRRPARRAARPLAAHGRGRGAPGRGAKCSSSLSGSGRVQGCQRAEHGGARGGEFGELLASCRIMLLTTQGVTSVCQGGTEPCTRALSRAGERAPLGRAILARCWAGLCFGGVHWAGSVMGVSRRSG